MHGTRHRFCTLAAAGGLFAWELASVCRKLRRGSVVHDLVSSVSRQPSEELTGPLWCLLRVVDGDCEAEGSMEQSGMKTAQR